MPFAVRTIQIVAAMLDWSSLLLFYLGSGDGIELAPYTEPPDDVVTGTGTDCFHRCLLASSASELPESTSLFYPGVRELCYLYTCLAPFG
jgi:hypothetical protein